MFELRLKVIENGDTDVLVLKDGRSCVLECRAIECEERDDGLHIYPGDWLEVDIAQ